MGLIDGEPDPSEFETRQTSSGYENYEELEATEQEETLWVTGRSPTKYVDLLQPGTPTPRVSFEFVFDETERSLAITHAEGVSFPAKRADGRRNGE